MSETRIGNKKPALTHDPYDLSGVILTITFPFSPLLAEEKKISLPDPGQADYTCDR